MFLISKLGWLDIMPADDLGVQEGWMDWPDAHPRKRYSIGLRFGGRCVAARRGSYGGWGTLNDHSRKPHQIGHVPPL